MMDNFISLQRITYNLKLKPLDVILITDRRATFSDLFPKCVGICGS